VLANWAFDGSDRLQDLAIDFERAFIKLGSKLALSSLGFLVLRCSVLSRERMADQAGQQSEEQTGHEKLLIGVDKHNP
jgi:hypothetical protein